MAKLQEWTSRHQRIIKIAGTLFGAVVLAIVLFLLLVQFGVFGKIPSFKELNAIKNHTASELYFADGPLIGKYFVENRTNIDLEEVPQDFVQILITTEDVRFFKHNGVDYRALLRVLVKTILLQKDAAGGGSTLTQQLAKNLYPRKQFWLFSTPIAKAKEMAIARRLEKVYSKKEILNLYINTVPFAGNIYGVDVAARQFFGKAPTALKPEESAMLVGVLKGNSLYHPVKNPNRALTRRNTVLNQMKKYGMTEEGVIDSLKNIPIQLTYAPPRKNLGTAAYFQAHAQKELERMLATVKKPDGTTYNLYTDGLRVTTTLDSRMQKYAEDALEKHIKKLQVTFDKHWKGRQLVSSAMQARLIKQTQRYQQLKKKGVSEPEILETFRIPREMEIFTHEGRVQKKISPLDSLLYYFSILNAGFVAADPHSGAVQAWVGGIDFEYFQYDHVLSQRQVGSVFKPILYAKALQQGIEPCDYIYNRLVTYTEYDDWKPQNADNQYGGMYSMEGALSKSVNVAAVDLIMRIGVDSVRNLAIQMGFPKSIPDGPAIALGAADASLFDMIEVYSIFANRGIRVTPYYITKIENAAGEVIADYSEMVEKRRVLHRDDADMMVHMLRTVVNKGTASRLRSSYALHNDIIGKTGTTQSQADGWFMGCTPWLVAGAWVGGEYPQVRFRSLSLGQGANTALPIYARFMQKVLRDPAFKKYKDRRFPTLPPELMDQMDCPPFMEEEMEDDDLIIISEDRLDNIWDFFKKKKGRINESPTKKKKRRKRKRK